VVKGLRIVTRVRDRTGNKRYDLVAEREIRVTLVTFFVSAGNADPKRYRLDGEGWDSSRIDT